MLIELTNKCNEGCSHCMVNACKNGAEMSEANFIRALEFAIYSKALVINISGGECTLHSKFFKLMNYLFRRIEGEQIMVVIETNGHWIEDEKFVERFKKLVDKKQVQFVQVSTNKKYYPNYEFTMSHKEDYEAISPKIQVLADWQGDMTHLKYMGRAKNIMKPEDAQGFPSCMNIIHRALQYKQLGIKEWRGLIMQMVMNGKVCTPVIDVEGNIKFGEGCSCKVIDNLIKFNEQNRSLFCNNLFKSAIEMIPCDNCNCMKNISPELRTKLNEVRKSLNLIPMFENGEEHS